MATTETTGVVKIGSGLNVGGDGTLSVNTTEIVTSENLTTQLANYVTKTSLSSTLSGYVTSANLTTILEGYVTSETLNNYVTKSSLTETLENYVTSASLTEQLGNYVTSQALTERLNDYVTSQALTEQLANYATTAQLANYLPLAGGTMSGAIAMGNHKITGLAEPTENNDAVRLVDIANIPKINYIENYPLVLNNRYLCDRSSTLNIPIPVSAFYAKITLQVLAIGGGIYSNCIPVYCMVNESSSTLDLSPLTFSDAGVSGFTYATIAVIGQSLTITFSSSSKTIYIVDVEVYRRE